jgi:hypothetical protein
MTYESLNATQMGSNLAYIFVYANEVTNYWFGNLMVISFFIVVLLAGLFMQMRFKGYFRIDSSILVSLFVTLGFATIVEQYSGILEPTIFIILIGLTILAFLWNTMSDS